MESKPIRIGIPRGLFFYQYFPMLKSFFEELGAEVVISPPTNRDIIQSGCARMFVDICLPVKIFSGHVLFLSEKCDLMLIPSISSLELGTHNCPKLIGLPDLVRSSIPECPPLLAPYININNGKRGVYSQIMKTGFSLARNPLRIKRAAENAWTAHQKYQELLRTTGNTPGPLIEEMINGPAEARVPDSDSSEINIAVVGHPYMLNDEYSNHRLLRKLEKMGVRCCFCEMVPEDDISSSMLQLVDKPYWMCEREFIGAGNYYLKENIDAIISVSAFGCGPDSLMIEMLRREAQFAGKPYLNIVLDEHTSEGSLVTRLEAFVDLTRRARQKKPTPVKVESPKPRQQQQVIKSLGIPNFGFLSTALRETGNMLNIPLIAPPVTAHTVSIGSKYSPEFVCLPYKVILGTFIEALELGADTLFMVTSSNACRMGYFSKVQERTLRDLGYDFHMLRFHSSEKGLLGILKAIKRVSNGASWSTIISAYRLSTAKIKALDDIERKVQKIRPVELEKGVSNYIFRQAIREIDDTTSYSLLKKVTDKYLRKLDRIACNTTAVPLKIGIMGEIFIVMDPYLNLELEAELGKLGVEVRRTKSTFFSEWTKLSGYNVLTEEKKKLKKFAKPYLNRDIGGHGLESVGEKVRRNGVYDGIIHLAPFTCMPETVAQNIMLSTREKIPVLDIAFNEQTTRTGVLTRVEAFVDLLKYRRKAISRLKNVQ
ncbi:acyl-CoA dehydratase activase-related protein [Chloroflexota bacterium]